MILATLRRLRRWLAGRPAAPAEPAAIPATCDPVLQLLAVAEEAVAALERTGTEDSAGWAEAAVRTLERLAVEPVFVTEDPDRASTLSVEFLDVLGRLGDDPVAELVELHDQTDNPLLAKQIRIVGPAMAWRLARQKARETERAACGAALRGFQAAIAEQLVDGPLGPPSSVLAEHAPRLRERIAKAKGARCPA